MPAVTEHAVVCPVGCKRADGGNGYVIYQKHNNRENRKRRKAVGDHPVDFVGCGQFLGVFLFVTAFDNRSDIDIAFVGDDAFGVIVQLFFDRLNVFFDMVFHAVA